MNVTFPMDCFANYAVIKSGASSIFSTKNVFCSAMKWGSGKQFRRLQLWYL